MRPEHNFHSTFHSAPVDSMSESWSHGANCRTTLDSQLVALGITDRRAATSGAYYRQQPAELTCRTTHTHTPYENNIKIPKFAGNNTHCCSDKGGAGVSVSKARSEICGNYTYCSSDSGVALAGGGGGGALVWAGAWLGPTHPRVDHLASRGVRDRAHKLFLAGRGRF